MTHFCMEANDLTTSWSATSALDVETLHFLSLPGQLQQRVPFLGAVSWSTVRSSDLLNVPSASNIFA